MLIAISIKLSVEKTTHVYYKYIGKKVKRKGARENAEIVRGYCKKPLYCIGGDFCADHIQCSYDTK